MVVGSGVSGEIWREWYSVVVSGSLIVWSGVCGILLFFYALATTFPSFIFLI